MRAYIIRRLLLLIPTLLVLTIVVFGLVHLVPGDVVAAIQAQAVAQTGSQEDLADTEAVKRMLGLDVPVVTQYGRWLGFLPQADGDFSGLFQGNLGISWWSKKSVVELVSKAWPVTFELGLMAIIIAQLIALPIGTFSALRQDKLGDYVGRSFAILAISIPGFWLGTLIIVFPAIWWGHMIPIMLINFADDPIGNLKMFIVPAFLLGLGMCGTTTRMTRAMMLEVMRQDYIRTAWAKGLKERVIVVRHALKNALIPIVTLIGLQMPILIGGTVIIEQIFVLSGMGRLTITACLQRDHPLIMGVMVVFSVALMLINLVIDLSYAFLDRRVRYK